MSMMSDLTEAAFMGASVMDLISYCQRLPSPGETVSGKLFLKGTGGKAANACVMSSRLGMKCSIIAKIGQDDFGREMIDNFERHRIDTTNILLTKDLLTSTAAISVTDDGQNSIIYVPGPANLLTSDEIRKSADSIFFNCKLFVTTFECQIETFKTALTLAQRYGVPTLVNAAPPFPEPLPDQVLSLCHFLCLNESEASLMTGVDVNSVNSGQAAMQQLLSKGCAAVILTMGSAGVLYLDKSRPTALHVAAEAQLKPVDTTGAGDAFVGSFAYFLVRHADLPIEEKLRRSCVIAAASVMKKGTQSSYPWRDELPPDLFQ